MNDSDLNRESSMEILTKRNKSGFCCLCAQPLSPGLYAEYWFGGRLFLKCSECLNDEQRHERSNRHETAPDTWWTLSWRYDDMNKKTSKAEVKALLDSTLETLKDSEAQLKVRQSHIEALKEQLARLELEHQKEIDSKNADIAFMRSARPLTFDEVRVLVRAAAGH